MSLGGDFDLEKTTKLWPVVTFDYNVQRANIDILKKRRIQPFYFCEEIYKAEWEAVTDDDDLATVFSETNIMARRLQATRRKQEEESPKNGLPGFLEKMMAFNCCGARK